MTDREQRARELLAGALERAGYGMGDATSAIVIRAIIAAQDAAYDEAAKVARDTGERGDAVIGATDDPVVSNFCHGSSVVAKQIATAIEALKERT